MRLVCNKTRRQHRLFWTQAILFAFFHKEGNTPSQIDLLNIWYSGSASSKGSSRKTRLFIWSVPSAFSKGSDRFLELITYVIKLNVHMKLLQQQTTKARNCYAKQISKKRESRKYEQKWSKRTRFQFSPSLFRLRNVHKHAFALEFRVWALLFQFMALCLLSSSSFPLSSSFKIPSSSTS